MNIGCHKGGPKAVGTRGHFRFGRWGHHALNHAQLFYYVWTSTVSEGVFYLKVSVTGAQLPFWSGWPLMDRLICDWDIWMMCCPRVTYICIPWKSWIWWSTCEVVLKQCRPSSKQRFCNQSSSYWWMPVRLRPGDLRDVRMLSYTHWEWNACQWYNWVQLWLSSFIHHEDRWACLWKHLANQRKNLNLMLEGIGNRWSSSYI